MTDDIAICDACRSGDCDDCNDSAWSELANFPCTCDCLASGHSLTKEGAA